jgi:radical SAM protein with 4Fe4S-binding SPASM domain
MTNQENLSIDQCFEIWKGKMNDLIQKHPLQIISWEATRRCNLHCIHCGSPAEGVDLKNELSKKQVVSIFQQIANEFDLSQFRHINITGGEPFVRNDLIDILKEIYKYPFFRNIDIQTNGIHIAENPDILKTLKKYGVTGIGVSIDGLEKNHNRFRNIQTGFNKAVLAAQKAVNEGLVVTVSVVVHSKNIDELDELYNFVKTEIKPRVFRLMFIDPIGRAGFDNQYLLPNKQQMSVIHFLQEKYAEGCDNYHNQNTMMVELGCGGWFGKELEGTFRPFVFHCIAGINNLGILYDGKIASCSNISRDFIEGDALKDNINEIWNSRYGKFRNREWLKKGKCKTCDDWDYCHGGPMHLVNSKYYCYRQY